MVSDLHRIWCFLVLYEQLCIDHLQDQVRRQDLSLLLALLLNDFQLLFCKKPILTVSVLACTEHVTPLHVSSRWKLRTNTAVVSG
jgi:hypothetical protein